MTAASDWARRVEERTESLPLSARILPDEPVPDLDRVEAAGGYSAVRDTVGKRDPSEVVETVKDSGLRGRGGAGFPTGLKWSFVPPRDEVGAPRYLIANADEMEPGTFKDRFLMEGDPHLLIESMILAAWAIEADVGWIFLRWAYRECERRLRRAIVEAEEAGYLGDDVFGEGRSFRIHVHVSAGRYMCGEETGLLNALEGKRATPRAKPPYPQVSGLWGRPTIVQNVETLCNVPAILSRGADWYRDLAVTDDAGTKLYGASGRVAEPGLRELPMGATAREILEERAGGMRDGCELVGFQPGGGSTDFLVPEHLDVPLDYDSVAEAGSRLGTGTIIVLDDRTCPVAAVRNLEAFFARESCGWCTPCRDGLPWTEKLLGALCDGEGRPGDLERLERSCELLGPGNTFCALAPGAVEPLQSALHHFRDVFERHLGEKGCPWR